MKKLKLIIFGLMMYWFNGAIVAPVHAQSVNLSVSPPVTEILLSPNKKVSQTFILDTQGADITVTPELHLAKPADAEGHVTIDPNPLVPSAIPLSVTITGPNNSPTLTFEAASTDTPQDVYLALVFKAKSTAGFGSGATETIPAISVLILTTITPTGILPISLDIQNFTPPVVFDSWSSLSIHPTLQNHSSTMIRPLGEYSVISPTGKTVFSLPLYPNLILGNSSRLIQGSDKPIPSLDDLKSSLNSLPLSWSPRWHQVGPYRLHLTITSQGGTKLTEVEKVVWIFPIRLTILFIFLIIIVSILTLKLTKKITT
jgi:hypothetical protein